MKHSIAITSALVIGLLSSPAIGVEGRPAEYTYTTTNDFKQGGTYGHDPVLFRLKDPDSSGNTPDQLELADPPPVYQGPPYSPGEGLFPFINVACLTRGTIVRIDVNATSPSTAIVGQYYTAPKTMSRSPSRTTVDQHGNVWVVSR